MKKGLIMCMVTILLAMSICGCAKKETEEIVYEDLKVEETVPERRTVTNQGEFIGTVSTSETVTVISKVSGEVLETYFEEGDIVSEGDLLFKVDSTQAQQGIASAQAAYELTKANVDRMLGSTLDSQAINVTTGYKNSQIGLDTALYNYSNTCDKIGDARRSIEDLEKAQADLGGKIAQAQENLKTAMANRADEAIIRELQGTVSALESQKSGIASSIATLSSTKSQLESSVHTYENSIAQAEVTVESATANLNLTVTKVLAEAMETASATLNQAQVTVKNAKESLDNYQITSPVSGTIETISVEKYGMAQAGSPAYVITTDHNKVVKFYASESNIKYIKIGQTLTVEYADAVYHGTITKIADSIDQTTGLFEVEAGMTDGNDELFTGSSVKILVDTVKEENSLTVPLGAVYYDDEEAYVYLDVNGVATKTPVQTGIYDDECMVITEGLNDDSKVITSWSARLKDGEKVNGAN
ncbi:MAG: efflux RND transporter periplasmic adaptor subunit [Clostridia bacterium]|nr:efflux RND transporter periplasmic adaptor subunit [Clostridia bacterium]